jgi:hypothetical protein
MHTVAHREVTAVMIQLLEGSLVNSARQGGHSSSKLVYYLRQQWWPIKDKWCKCFWPRLDEFDTHTNNVIERYARPSPSLLSVCWICVSGITRP